jgi:hypothetical protein
MLCPRMIDKDDWSVVGDRGPRVGGCEMKTCDKLALIPFDDVHEYREEDRGGNPGIGTSHEVEGGAAMCVSWSGGSVQHHCPRSALLSTSRPVNPKDNARIRRKEQRVKAEADSSVPPRQLRKTSWSVQTSASSH